MKVKLRLQIIAILPIVLALVISMILAWMTINMRGIVHRLRAANAITRDAFLLDMITYSYLDEPSPANQQRWQTIYVRFMKTMEQEALTNPRDALVFKDIQGSLNNAKTAFLDLAAQVAKNKSPSSNVALNRLSRLSGYSRSMVDEALILAAAGHDQTTAIQMASFLLVIGTGFVLAIVLTITAVLVSRRIDDGLDVLACGTNQIAQGKLGHEIQLGNTDEFGELAELFNTMSRELKQDQDVIQAEMAAHKEAVASLTQSNIQLSDALTRLKRAQEDVVQQERLKALKQIVDGILHDLYDDLMPILGFSELMLQYPAEMNDARNVHAHIQTIHDAVIKAISVAKHLSEYFYPTRRDNAAPINITALLESVLSVVLPTWKEEGRRIVVKIEGNIPAFNTIESDLNKALTYIITNAVEAMEGTGTLTVRTRMEADMAVIEVSDTGPGMNSETHRRCLEPFFSTKGQEHSGMGLTIAQGAITHCHGALLIESLPGKGTTVIFRLSPIPIAKAAAPVARPIALDHKLRILVIDDEAWIRALLVRALQANGYEVETADNGSAAIEIFRSVSFDIVIVDLAMPIMSGTEVAAAVKKIRPRTAVIMLTGFGNAITERGGKPAGVDYILSKPMTLTELQKAIARVIA